MRRSIYADLMVSATYGDMQQGAQRSNGSSVAPIGGRRTYCRPAMAKLCAHLFIHRRASEYRFDPRIRRAIKGGIWLKSWHFSDRKSNSRSDAVLKRIWLPIQLSAYCDVAQSYIRNRSYLYTLVKTVLDFF